MQNIRDAASSAPGCELTGAPGFAQDVPSIGCLSIVIVNIINAAFFFLGLVCLIFLMYGAILFILSRGDQKALQKARGTVTYAIIGTVLVVLSFFIVNVITTAIGMTTFLSDFRIYVP